MTCVPRSAERPTTRRNTRHSKSGQQCRSHARQSVVGPCSLRSLPRSGERGYKHNEAGGLPASLYLCTQIIQINLVALQQIVTAFTADSTLDEAVALGATLQFQGNFSLRAGSDHHFNSFLERFRLGPGSKERGKLAKRPSNLKRLAESLTDSPARRASEWFFRGMTRSRVVLATTGPQPTVVESPRSAKSTILLKTS